MRDDLKPLLQVMQPDDVRKVLAVARAHDVWVQDVMAHRLPAILAAREPVGYLIHLIHSGEDWRRPVTPCSSEWKRAPWPRRASRIWRPDPRPGSAGATAPR